MMFLSILALVAAQQQQQPTPPLAPANPGPPVVNQAQEDAEQEPWRASSPASRQAIAAYGSCVADNSPDKSAATLRSDFRSQSYRSAINALITNNRQCTRRRSGFRGSRLLLAGAMAERLMARDASVPLRSRLARAAGAPVTQSFAPSDTVAICVVRSMPDEVAALFATPIADPAEAQAITALAPALSRCAEGQPAMRMSPDGVRAVVATAAFRQLAQTAPQAR